MLTHQKSKQQALSLSRLSFALSSRRNSKTGIDLLWNSLSPLSLPKVPSIPLLPSLSRALSRRRQRERETAWLQLRKGGGKRERLVGYQLIDLSSTRKLSWKAPTAAWIESCLEQRARSTALAVALSVASFRTLQCMGGAWCQQ
jgi:hypothetical protein